MNARRVSKVSTAQIVMDSSDQVKLWKTDNDLFNKHNKSIRLSLQTLGRVSGAVNSYRSLYTPGEITYYNDNFNVRGILSKALKNHTYQ